ncbi:MAG: class I SAM-dependent methyltransferase [Rhodobacteraceae bacterium]|nr:class I SAM-dependent methyltransferase [Paracoccaceae bacterium]
MSDAGFWNDLARKYATHQIKDPESYEYTLDRTLSYLTATDRVLELGCGTGSTALRIAPAVGEMVATDFSSEMILIAREKAEAAAITGLSFEVAGADDAADGAAPFDAVLAFNLIHLLPDPKNHIAAMAARLTPGGYLITKTPCLSKRAWMFKPAIFVMRMIGKAPRNVNFFSFAQYDEMMRAAGLVVVETDVRPEPFSRYLVARKR